MTSLGGSAGEEATVSEQLNTKGFAIKIVQYPDLTAYEVAHSAAEAKRNLWYRCADTVDFTFGDFKSCRRCPALDGRPVGPAAKPEATDA